MVRPACLLIHQMPFSLSFVLTSSLKRAEVLVVPELLSAACQGGVGGRTGWDWQSLCLACGDCLLSCFVSFFKDVNLKMPRSNQLLHFAFREDKQWKLQQIQDARNHVNQAIYLLMKRDVSYHFKTGSEVLKLMDAVMLQLSRARNRLTTPATLTLPEIASSGLTRMFAPALPPDILVNFYINLNKLCLTIYQLHVLQPSTTKNFKPAGGSILHNPGAMFEFGNQRYEVSHVHKVECVVPWLNDALVFFTVSLQLCQQLKDKISVFSSYWNYKPY
uniref:Protein rogdi homolog n=1 Tax=Anser brachyrhynchus TaxID=132585 RepID=A0A8B9B7M2_9AVES